MLSENSPPFGNIAYLTIRNEKKNLRLTILTCEIQQFLMMLDLFNQNLTSDFKLISNCLWEFTGTKRKIKQEICHSTVSSFQC